MGAIEFRFARRDGGVETGSDHHFGESRLLKARGNPNEGGVNPIPNRAEGIMVEGIHPDVVETLSFFIRVPTFPQCGGPVVDQFKLNKINS